MSQEENAALTAQVNYIQEGDQICATRPGFVDLASSLAGFGATEEEALAHLLQVEKEAQEKLDAQAEADRERLQATFDNLKQVALTGPQPVSSEVDTEEVSVLLQRLNEICEKNKWPMAAVVATFIPNLAEGAESPIRLVGHYALTCGTKASRIHAALCDARIAHIHAANMVAFREVELSSHAEVRENDMKEDAPNGAQLEVIFADEVQPGSRG